MRLVYGGCAFGKRAHDRSKNGRNETGEGQRPLDKRQKDQPNEIGCLERSENGASSAIKISFQMVLMLNATMMSQFAFSTARAWPALSVPATQDDLSLHVTITMQRFQLRGVRVGLFPLCAEDLELKQRVCAAGVAFAFPLVECTPPSRTK
ncbi:hypothetical protein EJ02DRAFT_125088 [Clathrospora elynae]|uniref:Uncharacterized protein n=1 Tax=Clathrospora elynae TaxID=706981 RepID=A0A6A5SUY1_9PLEO|nr:hypothetical protein EJ02DRAFT_125088 [Clathrospora elynae]